MPALLALSGRIDALNRFIGRWVVWLVLGSTLVSALNAVSRKAFNISSNAFLELQWYLFAASFLLAAGYTLLNNEHVRIDVVSARFSKRTQVWLDVFGFVFFLLPICATVLYLGVPFFLQGLRSGEVSANAGGLILWPVYALIPLGFALLGAQAISELIKRLAFLQGLIADPTVKLVAKTAEQELAEAIAAASNANRA